MTWLVVAIVLGVLTGVVRLTLKSLDPLGRRQRDSAGQPFGEPGPERAAPLLLHELDELDMDGVSGRVAAIVQRNFDTAAAMAEARGLAPGMVMLPCPTWRRVGSGVERSCTLLPDVFEEHYYAGAAAARLQAPDLPDLVAELVDALDIEALEPELEDVALTYEGDWDQAPRLSDDSPYELGDRPLSLILADVGRCLAAGATDDELRARYGAIEDEPKAISLANRIDALDGEEVAAYLAAMGIETPQPGSDLRVTLTLTEEEADAGTTRDLSFAHLAPCEACEGTGHDLDGHPCSHCGGTGEVEVERTVRVTVPAGIGEGQSLRLRGLGQPGRSGGDPGDPYVELSISG